MGWLKRLFGRKRSGSVFRLEDPQVSPPPGCRARIFLGPNAAADADAETDAEPGSCTFSARRASELARLPERMESCSLTCRHSINGHARPEGGVIQAWSGALGADLEKALAGGPDCRQHLLHNQETGDLTLLLVWSGPVERRQVQVVAEAISSMVGA